MQILRRELLLPSLSLDDNLVAMGMTSLGANRVAAAFYDDLGLDVPTYTLFQHRSVQHLVAALTGARAASAAAGPVRAGGGSAGRHRHCGHGPAGAWRPGCADLLAQSGERPGVHPLFEPTHNGRVNARGVLPEPLGFDEQFLIFRR